MKECNIAQGVWPKHEVHCLWPACAGMKQLLTHAHREVTDSLLGNAILEVSVHGIEGKMLALLVASLLERVFRELPIVTMIMLNFYAVLGGEGLEGSFGGDGLDG